jgi:pimeloyl-ACP methyl ester carboxylesterase
MARFVLVHGAWHGGWCWEPLAGELESRGHEVWAPDLPSEQVGLTQWDYAAAIGSQRDAVVVGHSLGGLTIGLVEARLRVYLAALLPVEDAYARFLEPGFGGFVRDELGRSYWPDLETAAIRLYPDCPRAVAEASFARLRRQAPLTPHAGELRAQDVAIGCLRDVAVNAQKVRALVGRGLDLDAGHFSMLTHPRELADALEEVAFVGTAGEADERLGGDAQE